MKSADDYVLPNVGDLVEFFDGESKVIGELAAVISGRKVWFYDDHGGEYKLATTLKGSVSREINRSS